MSRYPAPPPSYGSSPAQKPYRDDASDPLLGNPRSPAGPSNGFYDQPAEGDLPEDFKYGTSVSECSQEVRSAFVRKVYTILCRSFGVLTAISPLLTIHVYSLSDCMWYSNLLLLLSNKRTVACNLYCFGSYFTVVQCYSLGPDTVRSHLNMYMIWLTCL